MSAMSRINCPHAIIDIIHIIFVTFTIPTAKPSVVAPEIGQ
jgi:hypothetical protein